MYYLQVIILDEYTFGILDNIYSIICIFSIYITWFIADSFIIKRYNNEGLAAV